MNINDGCGIILNMGFYKPWGWQIRRSYMGYNRIYRCFFDTIKERNLTDSLVIRC